MGVNVDVVDKYIAKSADFAQPILVHLRNLVHRVCPEVKETIKWGFPNFEYKGIICSMAAFKNHCTFTFWKASVMKDSENIFNQVGATAMGQLGKIHSLSDLPSEEILISYLEEAVQLNEEGIKAIKTVPLPEKKEINIPEYLKEALALNEEAKQNFHALSYSHKKEYIDWFNEAKKEATRNRRLSTAIEWIKEGKGKNWKYMK